MNTVNVSYTELRAVLDAVGDSATAVFDRADERDADKMLAALDLLAINAIRAATVVRRAVHG